MNFLRTMALMRIADLCRVSVNGTELKTQSNLDIVFSDNVKVSQVETKDLTTLTLGVGQDGRLGYFGSFWDSTTQTAASTTTAYVVTLNSADGASGVSVVGGSKITVAHKGNYNLALSIQVTNDDTQAHDATFWVRKNGTDIAQSASVITVPSTHGGLAGKYIFYYDIIQQMEAGDYLQIVWAADNTNIKLQTLAAGVSPTHPQSPSVLVSFVQI